MEFVDGVLILGKHRCYCVDGFMYGRITCLMCNGSGKGIRGGYRGCKMCNGNGTALSDELRVPHDYCNGTMYVDDDWTSNIPENAVETLGKNIVIIREYDSAFHDYYKLDQNVYTTIDYGSAWAMNDLQIAERIQAYLRGTCVQACKVIKGGFNAGKDKTRMKMADGLFVWVQQNGMDIKPLFVGGNPFA